MTEFTQSSSLRFGSAPTLVAATWPSLNSISVGTPRMPYFFGVAALRSISTFTTFSLPLSSCAISSSAGAIDLHGPHHSAQKSTSTGCVDFRTSVSKLASLTWVVLIPYSFPRDRPYSGGPILHIDEAHFRWASLGMNLW